MPEPRVLWSAIKVGTVLVALLAVVGLVTSLPGLPGFLAETRTDSLWVLLAALLGVMGSCFAALLQEARQDEARQAAAAEATARDGAQAVAAAEGDRARRHDLELRRIEATTRSIQLVGECTQHIDLVTAGAIATVLQLGSVDVALRMTAAAVMRPDPAAPPLIDMLTAEGVLQEVFVRGRRGRRAEAPVPDDVCVTAAGVLWAMAPAFSSARTDISYFPSAFQERWDVGLPDEAAAIVARAVCRFVLAQPFDDMSPWKGMLDGLLAGFDVQRGEAATHAIVVCSKAFLADHVLQEEFRAWVGDERLPQVQSDDRWRAVAPDDEDLVEAVSAWRSTGEPQRWPRRDVPDPAATSLVVTADLRQGVVAE